MPEVQIVASTAHGVSSVDVAVLHPFAFVFMFALALIFGFGRIAKETQISVKPRSLFNLWTIVYVALLCLLMSVSTAMALVLLVDSKGGPRVDFIPPSFISISAAVLGVFGFEFLFRKFIIGFGENQIDLGTILQNVADQAVAATLKREVEG